MAIEDIQGAFFQMIKDPLPGHLSLVDEIADTLEVSNDSAYRRIRGETSLTFDEIAILSAKYGVSLDNLTAGSSDLVTFKYKPLDEREYSFEAYMKTVVSDLKRIDSCEDKEMIYVANDIPFFQLFGIPELASFKLFVWTKTLLNYKEHEGRKFELEKEFNERIKDTASQLIEIYSNIPSIEVFHGGTIETTLNQLEYYWVSGLFENKNDVLILCEKLSMLVEHMQVQADLQVKFPLGKELPEGVMEMRRGSYQLYFNEILATDNTILVRMRETKYVYLTNNGFNSLVTTNENFYKHTYNSIQNLLSKSTLISGTSEKERNRIFMRFQEKIDRLKSTIE